MVITSNFVAIYEISVQVVQFHVAFPHIFPGNVKIGTCEYMCPNDNSVQYTHLNSIMVDHFCQNHKKKRWLMHFLYFTLGPVDSATFYIIQYLSRGIQLSRASLNGALPSPAFINSRGPNLELLRTAFIRGPNVQSIKYGATSIGLLSVNCVAL